MTKRAKNLSKVSARGCLSAVALLWAAVPAGSQTAPCSAANANHWCADEDTFGVPGISEADDRFGTALAFGDFNGDGFDDLAVGSPSEDLLGAPDAGLVHVFYSTGLGLGSAGSQFFGQSTIGGADEDAEAGDEFGFALAAGDFNDDGFDDLAVGSPGEDLPEVAAADCSDTQCEDAGGVHVLNGGPGGLDLAGAEFIDPGALNTDLPGFIGEGARMGASLAVGDVNATSGDGIEDLLVGAPQFSHPLLGAGGAVFYAFGALGGLGSGGGQFFDIPSISDCDGGGGEQFGAALVAGDLDADLGDELAVGAPTCTLGGAAGTGSLFHSHTTSLEAGEQIAQTDYATATNNAGDSFGAALAIGDFDDDGHDDLAAGAPFKNHGSGSPNDSGRVYVARGTAPGIDPSVNPDLIGEDEWAGQTPTEGENFGAALAAGEVTGDAFADLLIGAPGEGVDGGFLFLKPGSAAGLTTTGNQVISQGFIGGVTEAGDRFGSVLAVGDVNGDGILEVAIGVPDEDVGSIADAGMVYVTHFFDPAWIFADGFESGDTSAWSQVVTP